MGPPMGTEGATALGGRRDAAGNATRDRCWRVAHRRHGRGPLLAGTRTRAPGRCRERMGTPGGDHAVAIDLSAASAARSVLGAPRDHEEGASEGRSGNAPLSQTIVCSLIGLNCLFTLALMGIVYCG